VSERVHKAPGELVDNLHVCANGICDVEGD
jgi:hypothetical protein